MTLMNTSPRNDWTREEIAALFDLPSGAVVVLVMAAAAVVAGVALSGASACDQPRLSKLGVMDGITAAGQPDSSLRRQTLDPRPGHARIPGFAMKS